MTLSKIDNNFYMKINSYVQKLLKICQIWLIFSHFWRFSRPSGTRGFDRRVRVWRVWIIWRKFGFGYYGFAKNGRKPVGFSGSGKPDPPLVFIWYSIFNMRRLSNNNWINQCFHYKPFRIFHIRVPRFVHYVHTAKAKDLG